LNGLISSSTKEEEEQEQTFASLGKVVEDPNGILEQINNMYCDASGRPYVDVRIIRALILHDPYEDPADLNEVLKHRGVHLAPPLPSEEEGEGAPWVSMASPEWTKPEEEVVLARMDAHAVLEDDDGDDNGKKEEEREEEYKKKEDKSRAVVLEMLGDLPSADIKAPENVLFICKLNPITDDEDLQLLFSRFDPNARAEIIRDPDTGDSLQYAFVEFTTQRQCNEAYFKMNNVMVDDRRIKVDFSQSVAKEWNKFTMQRRRGQRQQQQHGGHGGGGGQRRDGGHGGGGEGVE